MTTAVLLFDVPTAPAIEQRQPSWAQHIRNAAERVLDSAVQGVTDKPAPASQGRLVILFSSSTLFPASISFAKLEKLLQWTYAQAWAVAVERDELLFNVDVLLVPGGREQAGAVVARESKGVDADRTVVLASQDVLDGLPSAATSKVKLEAIKDDGSTSPPNTSNPDAQLATPDQERLPQYRIVALGGTFDHLHPGHKILLATATALCTSKLIIGITADEMLRSKAEPHLLESIEERSARVVRFVRAFSAAWRGEGDGDGDGDGDGESGPSSLEVDAVPLRDVAGPAGTEPALEALVLTEETRAGGRAIADIRAQNGLGPVEQVVIGVLGARGEMGLTSEKGAAPGGEEGQMDAKALAAAKVGSTAIRKWLASKGAAAQASQTTPSDA